jgi:hypothetical protein
MTYSYLISDSTVSAFPLGQPTDGRPRYGMTPFQARIYRWLVENKPHAEPFNILSRDVAWALNSSPHHAKYHDAVRALVERGWLDGDWYSYQFVHPVMTFRGARHG